MPAVVVKAAGVAVVAATVVVLVLQATLVPPGVPRPDEVEAGVVTPSDLWKQWAVEDAVAPDAAVRTSTRSPVAGTVWLCSHLKQRTPHPQHQLLCHAPGVKQLHGNQSFLEVESAAWRRAVACTAAMAPQFEGPSCVMSPVTTDNCSLGLLTRQQAFDALNGVLVSFVGDSTARRAGEQLVSFLSGRPFVDEAGHKSTLIVEADPLATGRVVAVSTDWRPVSSDVVKELAAHNQSVALKETGAAYTKPYRVPFGFNHGLMGNLAIRLKVVVFHMSTHDLLLGWQSWGCVFEAPNKAVAPYVAKFLDMLAAFKASPAYTPTAVRVVVRLPVAQGCRPKTEIYADCCQRVTGADPVNDHVREASAQLAAALAASHPDVLVLDMASWTAHPPQARVAKRARGVGRTACGAADAGGTHFKRSEARSAYVQMVLNAVRRALM